MNTHADMLIVVKIQRIKHTKGHLLLSCFGLRKFSVFVTSEQSAINAFNYVCFPPPIMHRHPSAQVYDANVLHFLEVSKLFYSKMIV